MSCLFGGVERKRLLIEAQKALPTGATVTVEHDDALYLGEVVSCLQNAGCWSLEIKVEQVLSGLQSLLALRMRLLGDALVPDRATINPFAEVFAAH